MATYDLTDAGLPMRPPGHQELAAAEEREAARMFAERDAEIAAQVKDEANNGGVY